MNTHTGIKTENFLKEVLFEEVLTRCLERAATDFSDHNVATLRKHGEKTKEGGNEKKETERIRIQRGKYCAKHVR